MHLGGNLVVSEDAFHGVDYTKKGTPRKYAAHPLFVAIFFTLLRSTHRLATNCD